jgi:hypothetical protein
VQATSITSSSRRQALRRAVDLECGVLSTEWEDVAAIWATDLSPLGMWLATDLPLALGDSIVVSFKPPRWPSWSGPVVVLAEVVRVGMPRRRGDVGQAGMGVRFIDLDPDHEARMRGCLLGMPPTLPSVRAQRAERSEEQLVFEDGSSFELHAIGALLTAGRAPVKLQPVIAAAEPRVARETRRCAPVARKFRTRVPRGARKRSPRREQLPLTH